MTAPVLAAPAIEGLLGVEAPLTLAALVPVGRPLTAAQALVPLARRGRPRVRDLLDAPSVPSRSVRAHPRAEPAGARDLETLLRAGDEAPLVFAAAREARARHSGDTVFLYGFVYFSTYCRNECTFCFYRADNDESPRYRKDDGRGRRDLRATSPTPACILVDLTMGEDPEIHDEQRFERWSASSASPPATWRAGHGLAGRRGPMRAE